MKLGYDLTIEQTQKLVMTQEMIQAIQILQFSGQELTSYVQEQLLLNPALETKEARQPEAEPTADDSWKEKIRDNSYGDISYGQWAAGGDGHGTSYEQYTANDITLPEHLLFQLQFAVLTEKEREAARFLIEALDDNGYLTVTEAEAAVAVKATAEEVKKALEIIHGLDPSGVGAIDLSDCLLIQLRNLQVRNPLAEAMAAGYLEEMAENRIPGIAKKLNATVAEICDAMALIRTLEPKPGRQFANHTMPAYIMPDAVVEKDGEHYTVVLNETGYPHLMISSYCSSLLNQAESDEALAKYLSGRINSAEWLIKSIEQRRQTIYNVISAVMRHQQDFLDHGPKALKPLTERQIAAEVGIHESTVSRSVNGKYVQTPRGIFEVRYFFAGGMEGGVSQIGIKEMIREMIELEDTANPLSDQKIAEELFCRDVQISRRTVAKYREELGILSSAKRRKY